MGLKGYSVGQGGGEVVEVQGGHIIRATGRKDRHSKVFTSKGPRDRRVRLSAHTAIQFYDVQDRLGYDRPSKAVDWLIKKAKSAIDKLETAETTTTRQKPDNTKPRSSSSEPNLGFQRDNNNNQTQMVGVSAAANIDPEDAMKKFFPATSCSNINFQNYPHHDDDNIVSRATTTPNLSQDLGLSLHPFQGNNSTVVPETNSFTTIPFETFGRISGWNHQDLTMTSSSSSEQQQEEERSNGSFMVNHHHHQQQHHHQPSMMTLLNSQQQQVFLGGQQQQQQRGTLQSSLFPHSFRSWDHQTTSNHHHHHHHHNQASNSVMFPSSSQFGSHGMMMMQGLSFPNTTRLLHGEGVTPPNSSSSPPNSHL